MSLCTGFILRTRVFLAVNILLKWSSVVELLCRLLFLTLCHNMSLSSFRSWSMWASWQRSLEMFSALKCWRGAPWERWSSGLTSSPPSMFWDITSRSPCLSRSCRGELLYAAGATECSSVWLVTGSWFWTGDDDHSSAQLSCHPFYDTFPSVSQCVPVCRKDQTVDVPSLTIKEANSCIVKSSSCCG